LRKNPFVLTDSQKLSIWIFAPCKKPFGAETECSFFRYNIKSRTCSLGVPAIQVVVEQGPFVDKK